MRTKSLRLQHDMVLFHPSPVRLSLLSVFGKPLEGESRVGVWRTPLTSFCTPSVPRRTCPSTSRRTRRRYTKTTPFPTVHPLWGGGWGYFFVFRSGEVRSWRGRQRDGQGRPTPYPAGDQGPRPPPHAVPSESPRQQAEKGDPR